MTNAEMFLKEEQFMFDISKGIAEVICYDDMEHSKEITEKEIRNWFTSNIKPTLTEDERIILKNMQNSRYGYTHIARSQADSEGKSDLYIFNDNDKVVCDNILCFDHLFQFIKERRKI